MQFAHDIAPLEYLETIEKRAINYFYAANKKQGVKINTKKLKATQSIYAQEKILLVNGM